MGAGSREDGGYELSQDGGWEDGRSSARIGVGEDGGELSKDRGKEDWG